MAYQSKIAEAIIRRLPIYYRYLDQLESEGVERISSRELGNRMNVTGSQFRQDISCFGGFGQQGYGYHVPTLKRHIGEILGMDRGYAAVLVGVGNMGRAIMSYDGFRKEGFRIVAAFDNDPHIVGTEMNGLTIRDFSELEPFLEEQKIDVGVICVPADNAQMVADLLVNNGIQALWNFAPVDLHHPDTVKSTNVHLSDSLHILTYLMNEDALFEKKKNHSLT